MTKSDTLSGIGSVSDFLLFVFDWQRMLQLVDCRGNTMEILAFAKQTRQISAKMQFF